jgi:hypothetical protein
MKIYFALVLFIFTSASTSFANGGSPPNGQLCFATNKIVCKDISISQRVLDKMSAITIGKSRTNFNLYYFWILTSEDCWQLCVLYQENGQWIVSSVDPPAGGGGYMGATQVCLDDNFNPGSQYNSFNNLC